MSVLEKSERYFQQLKLVVGNGDVYDHLLRGLYIHEFYSPIPLDENRASWGLWFRKRYMSAEEAAELGPCTVLEMMIGFSEQIDIHTVGVLSMEGRIKRYFWMMIENLGMLGFTDYVWDSNMERDFNNRIANLLDRRYGPNGEGSLFPRQIGYPVDSFRQKEWSIEELRRRQIWSQKSMFDILAWEKWKGFE